MEILSFVPVQKAEADEATGAVDFRGIPMTRTYALNPLPVTVEVPIVVTAWTYAGQDNQAVFRIIAHNPDGESLVINEHIQQWADGPGDPFKYVGFLMTASFIADQYGVYTLGLLLEGQEKADLWFPFTVRDVSLRAAFGDA
jgi:hypothetical protein